MTKNQYQHTIMELTLIAVAVLSISTSYKTEKQYAELKDENQKLRTHIESIENTCTDMKQVDTLILTMAEINAKDMEAFQEYQTVFAERLQRTENTVARIDADLDAFD